MKKLIQFTLIIAAGLMVLSGCSQVTIPPAHLGKELGTSGYSFENLTPGRHHISWTSQMVLLETATTTMNEPMQVIMQDKLTLKFDVKFRARIKGDENILTAMFNDITPVEQGENKYISMQMVYAIYGKMLVRNISRSILSDYTVEDVHLNYKRISAELYEAIASEFEGSPIEVSDVTIGNIEYPAVITQAVELAKERELAIERERAQAEIDLTKKRNEQLLAESQREIDMTKAQSIRDQNQIIANGVTPELLRYRELEVMEVAAENGNTMWLPYSAMQNPSAQVGMFIDRPSKD